MEGANQRPADLPAASPESDSSSGAPVFPAAEKRSPRSSEEYRPGNILPVFFTANILVRLQARIGPGTSLDSWRRAFSVSPRMATESRLLSPKWRFSFPKNVPSPGMTAHEPGCPERNPVRTCGVQAIPFTVVGRSLHPLRGRPPGKRRKNLAAASVQRSAVQ